MVTTFAIWIFSGAVLVTVYAYALYPASLWVLSLIRRSRRVLLEPEQWPEITITVPAYNEEHSIGKTLERLLEADYPPERRHILVVSDASTDRTDHVVQGFADRGVQLVRLPRRSGKTAAENATLPHLRGSIVVNTDASVRIAPNALKPLVAAFSDPTVGVASGRDISVGSLLDDANVGESRYVGYEMWVRGLETRVYGIVGASGCFFANRVPLHQQLVPETLSRDFAAPLIAREQGYRSVSVNEALCFVPRSGSLRQEYRRKVRTMTRGLETLFYKRKLLNPLRYGQFSWLLVSHKLVRWLVPWAGVVGLLALGVLVLAGNAIAGLALATVALVAAAAVAGWSWPDRRPLPRVLALPTYGISALVAGLHAWLNALRGEVNPVWEPTRRKVGEEVPY